MNTKIYRYLVLGLLFVVTIGCAPTTTAVSTVTPTQPLAVGSNIATTPTSLSTASPFPTESLPLNFFFPKIEKHCPENREVSIGELGIGNDLQIILSDPNQAGLWSLSVESPSPILIQKMPLNSWTSNAISPDGKRLVYTIWNSDHSSSTWIYDLENREQREVLNIEYWDGLAPQARWLSDQELLIVNSCHTKGCHFPLKILNITTGESKDVSNVESGPYDDYLAFFTNTENRYALYSSGNVGNDYTDFYVYDYLSSQKTPVFLWLQNRIFLYPYIGTNLQLEFDLNKIVVLIEQSYGFDIGVIDNSIEMLTQSNPYDVIMKRIFADTGSHFDRLQYFPVALDSTTNTLFLSMSYRDYIDTTNNIADFKVSDIEDGFFSLDFQKVISDSINYLVFKDYCFTMSGYFINGISPDGQIVAFGSDDELVLMNLETGYTTRLPNWRFVGWTKR